MPQSCRSSSTSAMTRATCSSALDGMQPRKRHVPPSRGSDSTIVTSKPSSAARKAAAYPPGPPPRTTSLLCIEVGPDFSARNDRDAARARFSRRAEANEQGAKLIPLSVPGSSLGRNRPEALPPRPASELHYHNLAGESHSPENN